MPTVLRSTAIRRLLHATRLTVLTLVPDRGTVSRSADQDPDWSLAEG